jgi:predicted alpha-1,2-mannosidase
MSALSRAALLALLAGCADPEPPSTHADTGPAPESWDPVDYVDPMIATGGIGYQVGCGFPGAGTPNGLVKLSPDTANSSGAALGAYRGGGYHYDDVYVQGFSHMHLYAVGLTDYGLVGMMPVDGMTAAKTTEAGYRARFDHADEVAIPGRYTLSLDAPAVTADLSATPHTGVHRYTFAPSADDPTLLIDLGHVMDGSVVKAAAIDLDPATGRLSGWMRTDGAMARADFTVWFDGVVSPPPSDWGVWASEGALEPGATSATGEVDGLRLGGWLSFDQPEIDVQIGISTVDADGAAANLAAERVADVDAAAAAAWETWRDALSVVRPSGGTDRDRTIFATALYHTRMMPTEFTDADLRYRGFDQQVHQHDRRWYTDMSLWDTYRTLHPLYTALWPDLHADVLDSLAPMVTQGGGLPRWPLATWDGGFMVGTPATIIAAEAALKGLDGWDADTVLDFAVEQATGAVVGAFGGPPDVTHLDRTGYYPEDLVGRSVANTQEVAISDHALGLAVQARGGDPALVEQLLGRGATWEPLYDPATGWVHGRMADGRFGELGDVDIWNGDYAEGNARQYLWMAPHVPERLIEVLGGAGVVEPRLVEFFEEAAIDAADDIEGLPETWYWHGNEVDLHAAWLFGWLDRPDLTQQWVDWIWGRWYGTGPDGLAGNDDGGTLSAWAAWAAMGLYPLAGTDRYALGAPQFPALDVAFGAGHTLHIERIGAGTVTRVELDGVVVDTPDLRHADLLDAHTLTFVAEGP